MKNLPYFKGGTCKKAKTHISFIGNLKALKFDTFEEFCNNADRILYTYTKYKKQINLVAYKDYIYSKTLSQNYNLDIVMKEKCFEWILSLEYDDMQKNDLYALLGREKKGK